MKKTFWAIGIAAVLCVVAYYGLNMLVFTGFGDPFLRLQAALSPDTTVGAFSCSDGYAWRVVQKDKVVTGNLFELGQPSRLEEYRVLRLVSGSKVIAEMTPDNIAYQTYASRFPTGEPFTEAIVFGQQAIQTGPGGSTEFQWQLPIKASAISAAGFDTAAACLQKNISEIERQLAAASGNPRLIGWMLRIDDSVARDAYSQAPAFECTDGRRAITREFDLWFIAASDKNAPPSAYRPYTPIGEIGTDGKVYKRVGPNIDMSQPQVALPDVSCTNSNGQTLQAFLASIPGRIHIVSR